MNDGLNELDQTHAVFSAMSSFWWRVLLFFALCMFGHFVGVNCAGAADMARNVWTGGPSALFESDSLNPAFVPVSWMWALLVGCGHPAGLLQLLALAIAFLFVWLSEDRYIHGFAIALMTQPLHSLLVEGHAHSRADVIAGLVVLAFFEVGVGAAYWFFLRQSD